MKIIASLVMNFGSVGNRVAVDDISCTTVKIDGIEPFEAEPCCGDRSAVVGFWLTPEFKPGQEFSLSIPSGSFSGTITSVIRRMENQSAIDGAAALGQVLQHEAQEMQVVTVSGQWNGKQGGINGGLSGLGQFTITEISSVEGTFGKAKSLEEYNARAARYRTQFWELKVSDSAFWYTLTTAGELQFRRYLSHFTLDVDSLANDPVYGWSRTPVDFALAAVRAAREYKGFIGRGGMETFFNFDTEIPCLGGHISSRSFRQWLDMQFPKLHNQLSRQATRTALHPTERNLRRLEKYKAAFAAL